MSRVCKFQHHRCFVQVSVQRTTTPDSSSGSSMCGQIGGMTRNPAPSFKNTTEKPFTLNFLTEFSETSLASQIFLQLIFVLYPATIAFRLANAIPCRGGGFPTELHD